jgi:hypothetical protein
MISSEERRCIAYRTSILPNGGAPRFSPLLHELFKERMNMNTFCTVKVESKPEPGEEIQRAFLHVLCDGGNIPVRGIVITGVYGDVSDSSNRCPFVIMKDGRGDYGSYAEGRPDRFFQTNIRTKPLVAGTRFTTSGHHDQLAKEVTTTYEVVEVTPLTRGS